MKERVDEEIVHYLWWLRPVVQEEMAVPAPRPAARRPPLILNNPSAEAPSLFGGNLRAAQPVAASSRAQAGPPRVGGDDAPVATIRRDEPKVGRNDPCPCGSGKKYKKC